MVDINKKNEPQRLCKLRDLTDYEVADNHLDIRGWNVVGIDGEILGKVRELIVDKELLKVRYLDIDLSPNIDIEEEKRHVLVPIGAASLDNEKDHIRVSILKKSMLTTYPYYDGTKVSRDYENSIRASFAPGYNAGVDQSLYYDHEHFDDSQFYGRRRQSK